MSASVTAAQTSHQVAIKEGLRVIGDQILIRPEAEESSLIWMPTDPHKRTRKGVIVAMGEGMKVDGRGKVRYGRRVRPWKGPTDVHGYNRYPMPNVKVGDRVIYLTWSLNVIIIGKVEHHLIRDTSLELLLTEQKEEDNGP